MKTNSEIRQVAKASLKGHWTPAVIATLVVLAITLAFSAPGIIWPGMGIWLSGGISIAALFVTFPLSVGSYGSYLKLVNTGDDAILPNTFGFGFRHYFHNILGFLLFEIVVALFLILLIVPGIIVGCMYGMLPFLLVEEPQLSVVDAMAKSRMMMKGHKLSFFLITLGFVGLAILSLATLCIALLWLVPFTYAVYSCFYNEVKSEYVAQ